MSDSRPFRDNPLLILVGIAILLAAFVALIWLPNYSAQLSPDFLSYSVLWGLSVIVLMMLVALAFVLARCFIKLWVEHRRAVPFARFRTKLVAALLASALIPAVLVLIVGSSVILNSVDRWFGARLTRPLPRRMSSPAIITTIARWPWPAMLDDWLMRSPRLTW